MQISVCGNLGAVEIELEIARCSQVARWKDGMLIFQNLQKIENPPRRKFLSSDNFEFFVIFENFRFFKAPRIMRRHSCAQGHM